VFSPLRRLRRRLRPSPSQAWAEVGERLIDSMKQGIDETEARRAELLASGLTAEEAHAVMWREMITAPGFPAMMAHAEGVARRSFPTLYEDDELSG
jgi:hypothetical protein